MSGNLPDGVRPSDIPGEGAKDIALKKAHEALTAEMVRLKLHTIGNFARAALDESNPLEMRLEYLTELFNTLYEIKEVRDIFGLESWLDEIEDLAEGPVEIDPMDDGDAAYDRMVDDALTERWND